MIAFVIAQLIAPEVILKLGITNREAIGRLGFRIGGPLVWSYSLGFILLPVVFLAFTNMFKGIASKQLWLLFTLLILIILAGQSKAAYLAYMTNFLFFCYLGFKYGRGKTMLSIFVLLILFLSMLIAYVVANLEDFGNIERFVSSITSNANDASTQTRLNQLSYIALTLDNNPYLGYPLEYVIIENGYGYYLYNYGLLGLLTYLGVLIYFFYKAWVSVRLVHFTDYDQRGKSVSLAYFSLILGAVVFSLANSPLDGHKVAYFFWTLSGLYYGAIYSTEVQTNFNK
ncbi:O-antigen ligase family protein [Pseudoalteromonas sp. P1-25]|uniref:O-antigen ligase family protein n=1 Tax=Pseudoalteromonas sp. P1-25 TaxID=1723758 RepID=UPI00128F92BE|nr:O-antigen ligase family protein [Pseudoalteromonas sp. P1-25]